MARRRRPARPNRKLEQVRPPGTSEGLTRREAERAFRKAIDGEDQTPRTPAAARVTVDDVARSLLARLALEEARLSYQQNCESMYRVHIAAELAERPIQRVTRQEIEALAERLLSTGRSAKTTRNVLRVPTPALRARDRQRLVRAAIRSGVFRALSRPRVHDSQPDIQLPDSPKQLDAVIESDPRPSSSGARSRADPEGAAAGPAPPPPAEALGPVLRVVILTAAMTGLRQSELLGLRWRDIDIPMKPD